MDNEKYGIELELLTDKFTKQVQKIKQQSKEIQSSFNNNKINFKINDKEVIQGFKTLNTTLKGQAEQLGNVYEKQRHKIKQLGDEASETAQKVNSVGYKRYDTASIQQAVNNYSKANQEVEKTTNSTKKLNNETKHISLNMGKLPNIVSSNMSKLRDNLTKSFSRMTSKIRRFGLALLSIRSIFALVSRASSAYLSQNEGLSQKVQNTWVKLGALLAPIIERIINLIDRAVNYIGKFIQGLTGVNLLAKVSAKSVGKTTGAVKALNKALAGFDELTNLDTDTGGGTGTGGAGGLGFGDENFDDYMNGILNAIRNANWYEVGVLLGEKLNEALKNIPWNKIQEGARTLASNIANFLNGFIETTNWYNVGNTIAQGINTAIEFAYTFVTTFKWDKFGKAIADTVNGFFKNIKWDKAGEALSEGIKGVFNSITTFLDTVEWDKVGESIGTFLGSLDYVGIATSVLEAVGKAFGSIQEIPKGVGKGLLKAISKSVSGQEMDDQDAQNFVDDYFSNFQKAWATGAFGPIVGIGINIAEAIKKGFSSKTNELMTTEELKQFFGMTDEELNKFSNNVYKSITSKIASFKTNVLVPAQIQIKSKKEEIQKNAQKFVDKLQQIKIKASMTISTTKNKLQNQANSLIKRIKNLTIKLNMEANITQLKRFWNNNIYGTLNKLFPGSVPKLAVGTNYVPQDQLAMIHKGEAVIPKKFNSKEYFNNNDETNAKMDLILDAINNIDFNPYTTIKDVGKASLSYINNKSRQLGESVVV